MNCPTCSHRITRVRKTDPYDTFVLRERACPKCNTVFTTGENPQTVRVYNPKSQKNEEIGMEKFETEGWREVLLNKKPHPSQLTLKF